MKLTLFSIGFIVGLPKSSRDPGHIFTSRKDGFELDKNSETLCLSFEEDSAKNISLAPKDSITDDKFISFAAVACPPTDS